MSKSTTFLRNFRIQKLANCGDVHEARRVFDTTEPKNQFTWKIMATAYVENGQVLEAKRLFDFMPCRDVVAWTLILSAYSRPGSIQQSNSIFLKMPEHNVVSWTAILTANAKYGDHVQAKHVFDFMPERNSISWNAMLTTFADSNQLEQAVSLFEKLPCRSISSWNVMISAHAKDFNVGEAVRVFESMPEHSIVSCNALLSAFFRGGDLDRGINHFDRMVCRNEISWNSVLSARVENGEFEKAEFVFGLMPARSLVTFTCMLDGYAENGKVDKAEKMYVRLISSTTSSSVISSIQNSMLAAYAHNDHADSAKVIFDKLTSRNEVSWNCLARAYFSTGCTVLTRLVLERMPCQNKFSLTTLISSSPLPEAKQLFDTALERDVVLWGILIELYIRCSQVQQAETLLRKMPRWDVFACTSLVAANADQGHLLRARAMFDRMPVRSRATWNALLAGYAKGGKAGDVTKLLSEMCVEGVKPDEPTLTCILGACSSSGRVELSVFNFREMASCFSLVPVRQHYSCIVDVLCRSGRLEDAKDLITSMPFVPDDIEWGTFLAACRSQEISGEAAAGAANGIFELDPNDALSYVLLSNSNKCFLSSS